MNDSDVESVLRDQEMLNRGISDWIASRIDRIGTTPNRLTMLRILLSFPLSLLFTLSVAYADHAWYGIFWLFAGDVLYVFCMLTDMFDGMLARYQQRVYGVQPLTEAEEYSLSFWERLNIRGSSHFGTVLDPFSDKQLYFGVVFPLGWNVVDHTYLWLSLLVALLLTLMRVRAIRNMLELGGKGASNRFGKWKVIVEVVAIASLALLPDGPFKALCANTTVGIALILGTLSLVGNAWLGIQKAARARKARATSSS